MGWDCTRLAARWLASRAGTACAPTVMARGAVILFAVILPGWNAGPAFAADPIMIFAAATLKDAPDAVDAAAEASIHVKTTAVYGPSPSLVKQLENGAPADIFFSADADWMNEAVARKVVDPASRVDLLSSKSYGYAFLAPAR